FAAIVSGFSTALAGSRSARNWISFRSSSASSGKCSRQKSRSSRSAGDWFFCPKTDELSFSDFTLHEWGRWMNWLAIRMLTGDRVKFFGLIFGVAFATFLMSQQVSVFVGIVARSASQIVDVRDASLWVMDPRVRHFDEAPGLPT